MKKKLGAWGATLLILGLGSFVLPLIGMQFRIFSIFGAAQPILAGCAIVAGAIMMIVSRTGGTPAAVPVKASPTVTPVAPAVSTSMAPISATSGPGASSPACPACGRAECVGSEFCGYTGQRITGVSASAPGTSVQTPPVVATAPPAPATPVPTAIPVAKRRSPVLKIIGITALVLVLAGFGYFGYSTGMFKLSGNKQMPQLPQRVSGTLSDFPVDSNGANPWKPATVSTQPLGPGASLKLPAKSLPPGITSRTLNPIGTSITNSDYKRQPADTPINISVITANGPSAPAVDSLSRTVAANIPQVAVTTVRVQSPQGGQYTGYRLRNSQIEVFIIGHAQSSNVIIVFAPDPSVMQPAEQLASSVGNGNGVYDYPEFKANFSSLPAQLPAGMELLEFQTFTAAELGLSSQQLTNSLGGNSNNPQAAEWNAQVQRFVPQSFTLARYRDARNNSYRVIVGEYSGTVKAWGTWMLLRTMASTADSKSVSIGSNSGIAFRQDGQYYVLFQTGPHLIAMEGPDGSAQTLIQLGQFIQL